MPLPPTQTLTGVLGLIPYAGGIIGAIILDIVVIIIDALGPSLLSSIVDGLKKVALDLTLQIAPSITDPLISMFVETIKSETDGADASVTDAANSGTTGDFGGGQLKVLIDLVMPMIKDAAEKILFPPAKPERVKCRIRLRQLRGISAPLACPDGKFEMPPEEKAGKDDAAHLDEGSVAAGLEASPTKPQPQPQQVPTSRVTANSNKNTQSLEREDVVDDLGALLDKLEATMKT